MSLPRSRFSRRHLLALCTFLVPLAVLALLGQNVLRRQGDEIEAGILSEARLYLENARSTVEQQIDRIMPDLVAESRNALADLGPVRAALQLREQERYAALLDVIVLDEQSALVWPQPPPTTMSLAFARDPRGRGPESGISRGLNWVDLLLTKGRFEEAAEFLEFLIGEIEKADEQRAGYVLARFRLATVHRRLGQLAPAAAEFEYVRDRVFPPGGQLSRGFDYLGLMSETALAEMGGIDDRIDLMHRMASNPRYAGVADDLLTAVVERLVEEIVAVTGDQEPQRDEALLLLREERQRAQTRRFAGAYDAILKGYLRRVLLQVPADEEPPPDAQIVATLGRSTTMLWVRDATEDERDRYRRAARIGLHVDLGLLLAPALGEFIATDSPFALAIHDPDDEPLVAPPATVPTDYVAPSADVRGLRLEVYPADAERLVAEADSRLRSSFVLFAALFVAAFAGALWLWRSVNREAELASLKVDLVSRVSHELKTPLALIRMYGETLLLGRARGEAQAQQFGGIIARESERLTTMIQRILDFSRQQAGTLSYSPTRVELAPLLHRICDAYTPHLEVRGAVLSDMVNVEATVICDENACESAIVNLLENAAKYALEGDDDQEVEVDLRIDGDRAIIEVRDRGRGIPAAECDQIFDPFYRATNSGEVRGAGIGLSLVRHFAESHGGGIAARERDGGGAVFRLTLPLAGTVDGAPIPALAPSTT
ncbi:MAG: HAMP domain-containing histidine kinase [Planctomycetes bacterium]|nr:HAMP domain-containing histidine kinase [Planctomycetota bacterium]